MDGYLSAVVDVNASTRYLSAVVDVKGLYPASTKSGLFVSCGGCERFLSCFNRK